MFGVTKRNVVTPYTYSSASHTHTCQVPEIVKAGISHLIHLRVLELGSNRIKKVNEAQSGSIDASGGTEEMIPWL